MNVDITVILPHYMPREVRRHAAPKKPDPLNTDVGECPPGLNQSGRPEQR